MIDDDQNSPSVTIDVCTDGKQSLRLFNCTADDCKQATQILSEQYPGTLGIGECCGEPIVV